MSSPLAFVTCGPAHESVDAVRRITNFSTGELGSLICDALVLAKFDVLCFRGEGATYPAAAGVTVSPFSNNSSLNQSIKTTIKKPDIIFHAAALSDFTPTSVETEHGPAGANRKIPSTAVQLRIALKPAPKILPGLRSMFPDAVIVGWKLEMDGTSNEVLAKARLQITSTRTDACVVNGTAYGEGYGFLEATAAAVPRHFASKFLLSRFLAEWATLTLRQKNAAPR